MGFDPKIILAKQGWSEGLGLGKNNQGNKDPIKVTYKFDKTGLGHDFGKAYDVHSTFSLSFDNAVQKLKVIPTEDGGVKLESTFEAPKVKTNKAKSVGNFVKSNRLNNGELAKSQDGESSDSDSDSDSKGLPAIAKMTDEELFKICGGMTGHRAAKFGINLSAKLARIKEQDELAAKSIKKENKFVDDQSTRSNVEVIQAQSGNDSHPKKPKKNKKAKDNENKCEENQTSETTFAEPADNLETSTKSKKSKRTEVPNSDEVNAPESNEAPKKKKKSKDCKETEECIDLTTEDNENDGNKSRMADDDHEVSTKKRRSKKAELSNSDEVVISESNKASKKKKKSKDCSGTEECIDLETVKNSEEDDENKNKTEKSKKKKKKRTDDDKSECCVEDENPSKRIKLSCFDDDTEVIETEVKPKKKKPKGTSVEKGSDDRNETEATSLKCTDGVKRKKKHKKNKKDSQ